LGICRMGPAAAGIHYSLGKTQGPAPVKDLFNRLV
jgi:hypothetical protein